MRVHAISDIHIDYKENRKWLNNLSSYDYKNDAIILAGDISHDLKLIEETFKILPKCFLEVFFVPGNHDLWVHYNRGIDSFMKLKEIELIADMYGIHMKSFKLRTVSIVPLFCWYDYSFGKPDTELINVWTDFIACRWPEGKDIYSINEYFISMNSQFLEERNEKIISFSHFLPSIEVMPQFIPQNKRFLYPVMGSSLLMDHIRKLGSSIHVYGHSHVNVHVEKDGVLYINNAFGYPHEIWLTKKKLKCIYEE